VPTFADIGMSQSLKINKKLYSKYLEEKRVTKQIKEDRTKTRES
jgi:hypothetical protein